MEKMYLTATLANLNKKKNQDSENSLHYLDLLAIIFAFTQVL